MPVSWPVLILLSVAVGLTSLGVWAAVVKTRFVVRVPEYERPEDLDALKRLAALDMLATLLLLGITAGAVALGVAAVALDWMSPVEATVALAVSAVALAPVGVWNKLAESRVRSIPASGRLRRERDEVVRIWHVRPFPPGEWFRPPGEDDE